MIIRNIFWILVPLGLLAGLLGSFGLLVPVAWWRSMAVLFAILSLLELVLFWRTWPAFNTVGAFSRYLACWQVPAAVPLGSPPGMELWGRPKLEPKDRQGNPQDWFAALSASQFIV